jgi:hypothetical protein
MGCHVQKVLECSQQFLDHQKYCSYFLYLTDRIIQDCLQLSTVYEHQTQH